MHINILLLIINMFLKKFKESKRIIITSIILIVFLILTGLTASLQRATIFYILKNINIKFYLRYSNIKLLFIVAFIILFINHFLIYDLGFIYSFIVCFGIFYYSDFIKGNYVVKLFKLTIPQLEKSASPKTYFKSPMSFVKHEKNFAFPIITSYGQVS